MRLCILLGQDLLERTCRRFWIAHGQGYLRKVPIDVGAKLRRTRRDFQVLRILARGLEEIGRGAELLLRQCQVAHALVGFHPGVMNLVLALPRMEVVVLERISRYLEVLAV